MKQVPLGKRGGERTSKEILEEKRSLPIISNTLRVLWLKDTGVSCPIRETRRSPRTGSLRTHSLFTLAYFFVPFAPAAGAVAGAASPSGFFGGGVPTSR